MSVIRVIGKMVITVDIMEAIVGRRSIRAFKSQDIPRAIVEKLIEAAQWAPSAGNAQPWTFVIVRKAEIKRKLAKAALEQAFIEEAPVVIIVCADEERASKAYGERGRTLYCIQDTAAATQNIHLAAHSLGLGTCWVGAFDESKVGEIIAAPQGVRPVVMIPVGYPAETPQPRKRRPANETTEYEMFKKSDKTGK